MLARNVIPPHLMRANFPLVSALGVFHALHHLGLERVSFLEQLVHTFPSRQLECRTIPANLPIARPTARPVPPVRTPPYPRFGFPPEPVFLSAPVFPPLVSPTFVFASAFFRAVFLFANFFLEVTLFLAIASFFLNAFFIGHQPSCPQFSSTLPQLRRLAADRCDVLPVALGVETIYLNRRGRMKLMLYAAIGTAHRIDGRSYRPGPSKQQPCSARAIHHSLLGSWHQVRPQTLRAGFYAGLEARSMLPAFADVTMACLPGRTR